MDEHERLARIRLVTQRYNELQGLRAVLIGGAFAFAMGGYLITNGWTADGMSILVALGLAFAVIVPGMLWLDTYYSSTFGRVAAPSGDSRSFVPATVLGIVAITVLGPSHALIFFLLGAQSLWIAIRDWPFRQHHLVSAAAGAVAAAAQLTNVGRQAPDAGFAAGFLLIGAANVIVGFADHRVLVTSFALRAPDEAEAPQES